MTLTSAAGLISLLDDDREDVKGFALNRLNDLVGEFWAEISEFLDKIEVLKENCSFKHNKNAALLASKVYYHLAEYDEALYFALCAQELFDINAPTEFTDTLVSKCMDKYIELRSSGEFSLDSTEDFHKPDNREKSWSVRSENFQKLELVVNRMFERCFAHKQFRQALGMAIETRRMDMFKRAILSAPDRDAMLRYAYRVIVTLIDSVHLRTQLLRTLVRIYSEFPTHNNAINTCQCLLLIDDVEESAKILEVLILRSPEDAVTAYQICFDLYENATQNYLERLRKVLGQSRKLMPLDKPVVTSNAKDPAEDAVSGTGESATSDTKGQVAVEEQSSEAGSAPLVLSEAEEETRSRLNKLLTILSGDKTVEFYRQFLIRHNKGENRLLERIREETRHSVTHMATTLANGIMFCGTTWEHFLRKNLPWLRKAVNWAKFTATSCLGVIHKGNEQQALEQMSAYLPKDNSGSSGSIYSDGGCLYALGLIHANHGGSMIEYLLKQVENATAEPVRHGGLLGLGLAAMGTSREDIYEVMRMNLLQDDAVTGEAAGIAMGLLMLGTGSKRAVGDLLSYARDTAHEKIIRGIALGIAMIMYGQLEDADELINKLVVSNDPILRWCGMATIAMAYCGTGNNGAVQKLLHAAVSDTNDDVRRWAVTALGFILFKTPNQVPTAVSLLTESYHPHVQYGAAMAMGIACAGTAMKEALHLLESLCDGPTPFVRQGALIATAMVLIQQNGITCPKSVEFREKCFKIISDRHEDLLTKFGAILACGIVDAGGGNMTISLQTRTGNNNMAAAVGLLVFQNYWFWYPLTNFISLALTPTALIALNKDLNMPKMQFRSNAKPQTFAHPQVFQPEKEKKKDKVETAILSITAKQRKKEADRRQHREQRRKDSTTSTATAAPSREEKMEVDPEPPKQKSSEHKEEKEPNFKMLFNPARVMWAQQRVMSIPDSSRYCTIKPVTQSGILMVVDRRPTEPETLVEMKRGYGLIAEADRPGAASTSSSGRATTTTTDEIPRVHAIEIGACVDSSDDEDDEEEEGEEEDATREGRSTEEAQASATATVESTDVHMADSQAGAEPKSEGEQAPAGTGKRSQAGKVSQSVAGRRGVRVPVPFPFVEDTGKPGGSTSADSEASEQKSSSEKNPPKDESSKK